MPDRLDAGGEPISANSIRARLGEDNQRLVDQRLREWFGREADAYTPDEIRDASRDVNR